MSLSIKFCSKHVASHVACKFVKTKGSHPGTHPTDLLNDDKGFVPCDFEWMGLIPFFFFSCWILCVYWWACFQMASKYSPERSLANWLIKMGVAKVVSNSFLWWGVEFYTCRVVSGLLNQNNEWVADVVVSLSYHVVLSPAKSQRGGARFRPSNLGNRRVWRFECFKKHKLKGLIC